MLSGERPGQPTSAQRLSPALQPPAARPPAVSSTPHRHLVWLALGALLVSGLVVVFVLPRWVAEQPGQVVVESVPDLSVTDGEAGPTAAQRQAEQTLQQFLHLQAALQRDNAPVWAEAAWTLALQQARDADRRFGERRFERAARQYATALTGLQTIQASRAERLAQALASGWQALDGDDAVTARQHFQLALAIDAQHAGAQHGLARARVRPAVREQVVIAAAAEQAGQWTAARAAYQAAVELDKDYTPASAGLQRVEQHIRQQTFSTAMDDALKALDSSRLAVAEKALQQAAEVNPQAPSLQDARRRLADARQQAALADLRRRAAAESRAERWPQARTLYQRALKIDGNAAFAQRGVEKAGQRAALHQQFDHYLQDPGRLYAPEPLANAERLVTQVKQVPDTEPRLAKKLERLRVLTREARQPIRVKLQSDGETEVVIYHVGRLGRFTARQLELRPGTYTAVGSRPGYRDVRREFQVRPGQPLTLIDIRCQEPV